LLLTVNCKEFFQLYSYCFSVFQLLSQLQLHIFLQLQLQLTDVHFSVITGFQLQLLLTGITQPGSDFFYSRHFKIDKLTLDYTSSQSHSVLTFSALCRVLYLMLMLGTIVSITLLSTSPNFYSNSYTPATDARQTSFTDRIWDLIYQISHDNAKVTIDLDKQLNNKTSYEECKAFHRNDSPGISQ